MGDDMTPRRAVQDRPGRRLAWLDQVNPAWLLGVVFGGLVLLSIVVTASDGWFATAIITMAVLGAAYLLWRRLRDDFGVRLPAWLLAVGLALVVLYVTWWRWSPLLLFGLTVAILGFGQLERWVRQWVSERWWIAVVAAAAVLGFAMLGQVVAGLMGVYHHVVAAAAAYVAITLGSDPWEKYIRRSGAAGLARVAGAVGLVAAVIFWWLMGNFLLAVAIVLVIVIAAALLVYDTDAVGLILLVGVAVIWAALPRNDDTNSVPEEIAAEGPFLVAVGDSYMSGEGAPRYETGTNVRGDNTCRRSLTTHAELLPGRLGLDDLTTVSIACSGAEIADVSGPDGRALNSTGGAAHPNEPLRWPTVEGGSDQLTQLRAIADVTTPEEWFGVMVSVGGNDAGFAEVGIACVGAGDCSEIGDIWLSGLPALGDRLVELYREIDGVVNADVADGEPRVPLVAVGYPISLQETGCWWTMLQDEEHEFVVHYITQMNRTIADAARRADIAYLDAVEGALQRAGNRICENGFGSGGVNFLALNPMEGHLLQLLDPRNWVNNSFHPNPDGHEDLADASEQWWAAFLADPSANGHDTPPPDPAVTHQCREAVDVGAKCSAAVDEWARQELVAGLRSISFLVIFTFVAAWLAISAHRASRNPSPGLD